MKNIEIINGKPYQLAPENTLYKTRERLNQTLTEVQAQLADVNTKIAIQEAQTAEVTEKKVLCEALGHLKVEHNMKDSLETIKKIAEPVQAEIDAYIASKTPEPEMPVVDIMN